MVFQPTPDTAQLQFVWKGVGGTNLAESEAEMSLYVRDMVGAWDSTALSLLSNYGVDWWTSGKNAGAALRSLVSTDWRLETVSAKDLEVVGGAEIVQTVQDAGTRAGDPVPPTVSMLIQYQMLPGGFPKRGWVFFPGGVEGDIDGNYFTGTFRDECRDAFVDFDADLSDSLSGGDINWAQVRVSRSSGTHVWGTDPNDPPLPKLPDRRATALTRTIFATQARLLIATQKDRRAD